MNKSQQAISSIVLSSILFGSMGVLVRLIAVQVPAFAQVSIRIVFATIILIVISLLQDSGDFFNVTKKELAYYAVSGIFGYGLMLVLFTFSILTTTIGNAYFLLYTQPVFTAILAYFLLKEKISGGLVIAIAFSFLGILMIFNPFGTSLSMGDAYGLGAGLLYAIYILVGRYMRNEHTTYTNTVWTFVFAVLFLLPVTFLVQNPLELTISSYTWLLLILFAIINVSAYILLNYGLKSLKATYAGILLLLEPVSSVFFALGFFGEFLTFDSVVGSLLIISSIVYLSYKTKKSV